MAKNGKKSEQKLTKETKLIFVIVAAIIAVFVIAAVITFVVDSNARNQERGSSVSNISNGGFALECEEGIFYSNMGLMKLEEDGSATELVSDSVDGLNYWDGYIYYSSYDDKECINRIRPDGTGREKLTDIPAEDINIVNGKVYFSSKDEALAEELVNQGIYEMNLDGSGLKRITTDDATNLCVHANRIYFINRYDDYKLYSMNLSGGDRKVVTSDFVYIFTVSDEWIVYGTSAGLFRIHDDGAGKIMLSDQSAQALGMDDEGNIYFCGYNLLQGTGGVGLLRTDMEGSEPEMVRAETVMSVCIVDGDLLYASFGADGQGAVCMLDPADGNNTARELPKGEYIGRVSDAE